LGDIVRVKPDGTRSVVVSDHASYVAIVDGTTTYVTNNGIVPGSGEVLRIVA
jgi:hypothetical protein